MLSLKIGSILSDQLDTLALTIDINMDEVNPIGQWLINLVRHIHLNSIQVCDFLTSQIIESGLDMASGRSLHFHMECTAVGIRINPGGDACFT